MLTGALAVIQGRAGLLWGSADVPTAAVVWRVAMDNEYQVPVYSPQIDCQRSRLAYMTSLPTH